MDRVLEFLADYAISLTYERLPQATVYQVKRHLIDAFGCVLGGYFMEPPRVARAYAMEATSGPGATVFGTNHRSTPELAAFANGVMLRYLDFNDTSMSVDGCHSSDNIPAVLAAADYAATDIKTAIVGIVLGYEVQDRLADVCGIVKNHNWDHVVYLAISTAAATGKVLGLTRVQMANAIALAATFGIVTGQTRTGTLSMWKGCAAGNAAREGMFAAMLARRGITGPAEAFTGRKGFLNQLAGGDIELPSFGGDGRPFKIEESKIKFYPTDYETQCAIHPMLELRALLEGRWEDVEKVTVSTYQRAIDFCAEGPEKWAPTTRETADHSLPYVLATAFINGDVWLGDFTEERIRDPRVLSFMRKIEVSEDPEFTRADPQANCFRIRIGTYSGREYVREIRHAKGHPKNPMTDQEVEAKFLRLAEPVMTRRRMRLFLDRIWHLEETSLQEIFALLKLK